MTTGPDVVSAIWDLFSLHRLERMATSLGTYSLNIIREFYVCYMATVIKGTLKKAKIIYHPPLQRTLVHDVLIDISETIIRRFLYGTDYQPPTTTAEFEPSPRQTSDERSDVAS